MRVKWTDTPAGAMRWHSYSITVFQDGTMKPSFFFQSVMGNPPVRGVCIRVIWK